MRLHAHFWTAVVILVGAAIVVDAIVTFRLGAWRRAAPVASDEEISIAARPPLDPMFVRWANEYTEQDMEAKTPIPLNFSRAFSSQFTKARGKAELDFRAGRISVEVDGLDEPADGAHYEVWLVDHVESANNTAAIELGEKGDRILNLGAISITGSMQAAVEQKTLAGLRVDMAAIMQVGPGREPEFVIGGMQSIRYQIGREAQARRRSVPPSAAEGLSRLRITLVGKPIPFVPDVGRGRVLFNLVGFNGNGRTCATCHPLPSLSDPGDPGANAFGPGTIDADFVAVLSTLLPDDPLFVSETSTTLRPFDPSNPLIPAFEFPDLMHSRGLILENINGFAVDNKGLLKNPPFFRAVPGIFNLDLTAPFGLSGNVPDLQTFSTDAVVQHFPKTLNRNSRGSKPDFRLPTSTELKDMEAFMLLAPELSSPRNGNFILSGLGSLLSINDSDPMASNTARPEIRGRNNFVSIGCTTCHSNTVFAGGNFNTSVELAEENFETIPGTPTRDTGFRNGRSFQAPQLFGLRKRQFFHSGLLGNQFDAFGSPDLFGSIRQAIDFYLGVEFAINDLSLSNKFIDAQTADPEFFNDIAAFLVAISVP